MAVNKNTSDIMTLTPALPDPASIDWTRARVVYDRVSDELSISFDGVVRAAASIALDIGDHDYIYARVNPTTGETVGLQIDGFLSYAIRQHPDAAVLLTQAELRGYDDLAAAELRRWAWAQMHERADVALSAALDHLIA
ncbi:MAG: hypothetical protein H0W59_02265 [Chloroflexia bacterium]|nr:hypothetical protein [Chloroflexia bacterium]